MNEQRTLTRRAVSQACFAAAAGAVLGSVFPGRAGPQSAAARGRYIDIHTHLGQVWNTSKELTADDLLKWMDEHEIERACVLPLVSPEASSFPISTDFVLEQTKPHRDRLIPFCSIDPRTSYNGGPKGLAEMLKRYADRGCKGFGEHKAGIAVDDPRSMIIYAACGRLGLPVLFHLDAQRNLDAPGLPGLEKAVKAHPQTTFIGHGPGWWASISGKVTADDLAGYSKGDIAPGGAIDRLMDTYPNLFGDLSAGSGAGALSRDPKFAREFLIRRADRLMFGTDYLAPGQVVPQFEVLSGMKLPMDVEARIYRDNASRVLNLDEKR